MFIRALLFCALAICAAAWTEEGNVLVLTDEDFPAVFDEFSHILVEFYAPWCGHCKKLAPIYAQVADQLKEEDSIVRVAKVDATENQKSAGMYQVQGYPTLYFFLKGEKMDYSGQRNKQSMLNWLLKKTRDPVVEIEADKYASLAQAESVSVVYHGDFPNAEQRETLIKIAAADDYNTYYWGKDLGKDADSVEIITSFAGSLSYPTIDDGLKDWVAKNQRPLVVPFDDRTINDIFGSSNLGVVLFNSQDSGQLSSSLTEAAKEYSQTDGEPMVFTEISAKNQHLENLANYIKINVEQTPIVIIEAKEQNKYVLTGDVTKESLLTFLSEYKEYKYGLTDEVKAEGAEETTEEEL